MDGTYVPLTRGFIYLAFYNGSVNAPESPLENARNPFG